MAIRTIREIGDEVLTKTCKEVTKMTLRTKVLILRQFHLKTSLGRLGPLCKNIKDQGASVKYGCTRQLLQRTDLRG